jgi:SAM-dependent methyltransferase
MPEPLPHSLDVPPDARRAAARTRDAVRAAFARAGLRPDAGGPGVDVAEPEAAAPVAGLARALAEAAARPSARLSPGGGYAGSPFPAEEPYVAGWELRLLSERRAAGPARTAPAPDEFPLTVRGRGGDGPPEAFSPWLVHSFASRKAHPRPEVLALVPPSARTVLDVGCGEGEFGAGLEARGARVTGIELDPRAARVAAGRLSRVLALPAEEAVEALGKRPDVVVLADVVEHLARPSAVLRAVRAALAPGGLLVFSVPNATHASVLGGALRGRWDRELEGIVADDHRTYAGREGWTALLASCGFRVTSLRPVAARTRFSEGDRAALLASTRLEPEDLDAVQWLGTAEAAAPGPGAEVLGAREEGGPLGAEDPVAAVAAVAASGARSLTARNAVFAGSVEALLGGGLVSGGDAAGLLSGFTPSGLAERFEGSGLRVSVETVSTVSLPAAVRAAVEARRAAGLPTDEAALSASAFTLAFGPAAL